LQWEDLKWEEAYHIPGVRIVSGGAAHGMPMSYIIEGIIEGIIQGYLAAVHSRFAAHPPLQIGASSPDSSRAPAVQAASINPP